MTKTFKIILALIPVLAGCSRHTVNTAADKQIRIQKSESRIMDDQTRQNQWLDKISANETGSGKTEDMYLLAMNNFISSHKNDPRTPKMIMKLGDYYFNQVRYSLAVEKYLLIVREHENTLESFEAIKKIALAYARNGEFENAGAWYSRLKSASWIVQNQADESVMAGQLFRKARQHEQDENFKKAGVVYINVALKYPELEIAPKAMLRAGMMMENMGDFKNAVKIYQKFSQKFSESALLPEVLLREADCWRDQGRFVRAAKKYLSVVRMFPSARQAEPAMFRAGQTFHKAGEGAVASRAFERYWELYPDGADACKALQNARKIYKSLGVAEKDRSLSKIITENCRGR